MRNWRIIPVTLVLMLMGLGSIARAGEVEAKHISKEAKWYIHLDIDALKKTVTYTSLLDAVRAQAPIDEMVQQIKAAVGVNPLTDISAITVYNTSFEKDVAAIIFYAKIDQFMLQQALANNPEYKQQAYGKRSIQTWTDPNDGKPKAACFHGDGIAIMGNSVDTLKMAIDVLDGAKPGAPAIAKAPGKNAFLYAGAFLGEAPDKKFSQLLSASEPAVAFATEDDNKLQVSVSLTAKTAEQAQQLKRMLDGLKAFAELATAEDQPSAAKLLNQIKTNIDGAKVLASFQHDVKTLLETVKKLDEEHKARKSREAAPKPEAPKP